MVLDHIADCSSLIVETSSALYAEVLRHRDLDTLDIVAVPERLDKCVGKTEGEHIVYCTLAEIVVDAKDVALVEDAKQNSVEFLRRCEIVAERLFHDDSC